MAEIRFQILGQADMDKTLDTLSGSGLAFYGSSPGSSVQIGAYQDTSWVSNADGSEYAEAAGQIKYLPNTFPSGMCTTDGFGGTEFTVGLSGVKTFHSTLGIEFGHTTAVKTQNVQLRIYDRSNVNYPASGVNTKVAEIINHNGQTTPFVQGNSLSSAVVGSGDLFWWGEPWPSTYVGTRNSFTNSSGQVFKNGLSTEANTNGDSRLATAGIAGSYATVGGTGIIVPLSNSPGSGQKQLNKNDIADSSNTTPGLMWPKWTQYLDSQTTFFTDAGFTSPSTYNFGNGTLAGNIGKTYGGTGVDTHHTWAVALSASPLSIGSKEKYGLYISLEYL
jgi:hypothetical protein